MTMATYDGCPVNFILFFIAKKRNKVEMNCVIVIVARNLKDVVLVQFKS
jgi:hypothetical protein